jgi:two-component system, cell cycle sensor histidine kinase and response regulator CckA
VTTLDPMLWQIKADAGQIEQVIMNLALNARDAMPNGGKLLIETKNIGVDDTIIVPRLGAPPGEYVALKISDNGVGMDTETQSHLFEPFFTTKEKNKGTGLGLSTVFGIIQQSRGHIGVVSERERGTTFTICIHRSEEMAGQPESAPYRGPDQRATETILLVEDEESVRALTAEVLRGEGYIILEAQDAASAIEISSRHDGPIHLLLTDVVMPGPSGHELSGRLLSLRPQLKVLYMSGYMDTRITDHTLLDAMSPFIQKPFTRQRLTEEVRRILDH